MVGSVARGRASEVLVWLVLVWLVLVWLVLVWRAASTSESARDKERLNSCRNCGMSVLSLVTSLLVGAFNALVDEDMSLSSSMVGIVATLVNLAALRRAGEICGGARGSSKKVDGAKEMATRMKTGICTKRCIQKTIKAPWSPLEVEQFYERYLDTIYEGTKFGN